MSPALLLKLFECYLVSTEQTSTKKPVSLYSKIHVVLAILYSSKNSVISKSVLYEAILHNIQVQIFILFIDIFCHVCDDHSMWVMARTVTSDPCATAFDSSRREIYGDLMRRCHERQQMASRAPNCTSNGPYVSAVRKSVIFLYGTALF